ncbi:hypothetical protein ACFE04_017916 [Oxalis oulophora]
MKGHADVKLCIPAVFNKFLQPIPLPAEEFFPQWRSLSGPPLKLQEVVRGVRPLLLQEMTNLLYSYRVMVCPGLDPNPNNLVASTTFYSESTRAMLCLQSSSELYLLQQQESINWFLAKKEELLRPAAPSASTFLLRQGKRDKSMYLCKSSRLGASASEFQDPSSDRLGQSSSSYCSSCCRFHGLLLH